MSALRVTGIVVAVALVPLGLFCRQCFISGRWSTVDASDRGERPGLLLAGLIVLLPLSLYFLFVEQSSALVQGSAAIGSMLAVGAALNRWIKLSGHLAMAGFTGLIGRIHLGYGLAVAVFIPLLAWSRLALLRHTLSRSSAVWPAV